MNNRQVCNGRFKTGMAVRAFFVALMLVAGCFGVSAQKTYLVAVGLNNYDNGQNPLPCSIGDARAISKFFDKYTNAEVFMLKDANATRDHILRVLKAQFAKSTAADEIIFAYSGHGFDGGISCYDTKNVIFCSEVLDILNSAKARRKIMFVNSCHSGSFGQKFGADPRAKKYKNNAGSVMLYFSSRANEYSWETGAMSTSFFFNRIIQALNGSADRNGDKKVTARELFNYVNERVAYDTDGVQHPQMYGKFPDDMVVTYVR